MFAQAVIGPPGSGKTTYCNGMQQFMAAIGRKVAVVNIDPANDSLPYKCAVDINDLVRLDAVMESLELGPNGGLMYCMEFIEKNLDWLRAKLKPLEDEGYYLIFDCPGQVELYTHHPSMRNILGTFQKWNYRLTTVHLVDSLYCATASSFISVLLLSLSTMLQLEMPHVNVLSKVDLLRQEELALGLDFYTEVMDLRYLRRHLDRELPQSFKKLNKAMCGLIEDFSLVSFATLEIQNKESVANLLKIIDKSNGYIFGGLTAGNESIMAVAAQEYAQFGGGH